MSLSSRKRFTFQITRTISSAKRSITKDFLDVIDVPKGPSNSGTSLFQNHSISKLNKGLDYEKEVAEVSARERGSFSSFLIC